MFEGFCVYINSTPIVIPPRTRISRDKTMYVNLIYLSPMIINIYLLLLFYPAAHGVLTIQILLQTKDDSFDDAA